MLSQETGPSTPLPKKDRYKVFIAGPAKFPIMKMFLDNRPDRYQGCSRPEDADIVLFTGGPDIDPQLYGQTAIPETRFQVDRDKIDLEAWSRAPDNAVKVGICRGAQFLNVMNGGQLWQDVSGHRRPHDIYDLVNNRKLMATSTHHQMMIPSEDAEIIAVAYEAGAKKTDKVHWLRTANTSVNDKRFADCEVCWYPETLSFCFQPHPEHIGATKELKDYFFQRLWYAVRYSELKQGAIDACAV